MAFKSKVQARAAFGGYLGPEMQEKAEEFAHATPGGIKHLPEHAKEGGTRGLGAARHKLRIDRAASTRHIKRGSR